MYIVLGAGLQGPAVAYGLSVLKPNSVIWLVEKCPQRMKRAKWLLSSKLECENISFLQNAKEMPILKAFSNINKASVISTLPYTLNENIAKQCIDKDWNYFDLGGHVQISSRINSYAKDKNCTVMTDSSPIGSTLTTSPLRSALHSLKYSLISPSGEKTIE